VTDGGGGASLRLCPRMLCVCVFNAARLSKCRPTSTRNFSRSVVDCRRMQRRIYRGSRQLGEPRSLSSIGPHAHHPNNVKENTCPKQLRPPGSQNRVPALAGCGKSRNVTSAGKPVTLCNSIWNVSSRSGETGCKLLYSRLLYITLLDDLDGSSQDNLGPQSVAI